MPTNIHNPFDVVMKRIVESDPVAMLHFLGLSGSQAVPFDADLSTISPQADYLLRVADPEYLAHIEFQSSYAVDMGRRMLFYAALGHYNHQLPVESVLVLLREQADGPAITGRVDYGSNHFNYRVIRLWEIPPEVIVEGPTALLPLLPLMNVRVDALPALFESIEPRIVSDNSCADLLTETMLLMGLKYSEEFTRHLLEGVLRKMRDSSTYQAILEEGRVEGRTEGERNAVLRGGTRRFGPPDTQTKATLDAIDSLEMLDRLFDRLFEVSSWEDLLR